MIKSVHQIFAEQVRQSPRAVAIDGPTGAVTYEQLDQRSNAIAIRLGDAGVKRRDIVAIAMERTVDAIASFLAVLKVGAAYCPLDLADPPARHRWMLNDVRPAALLVSRPIGERFAGHTALLLYTEEIVETAGRVAPAIEISVDDPACVMYTSGSTGLPKGALIPHRGVVRLFADNDAVPLGPHLRMLLHSPMHFDATTYEMWAPLLSGGACVLFSGDAIPSLHEFREHLLTYGVNTLFLGPALFNLVVDEDVHLLDQIDTLLVGGDALSARHVRAAQSHLPRIRIVNGYGPTETTTFATMHVVPRPFPPEARSVPIGRPIASTTVYILDSQLQPVAEGIEGELFIGGDGVALGYLNRPELTAERFLPDPFVAVPQATMYRTGDLCRLLADGCIDFIGRSDGQVKIRGRRIELGEIEANLLRHFGVSQCVGVIVESGSEKHIAAYYVPFETNPVGEGELRCFLEERLPAYLVPRDLISIAHIPRRPNGKIDRTALPAARRNASVDVGVTDRSRQSHGERLLLELWRQVLTEPEIGPDASFFASGGTSLDAIRLCCLVERHIGQFIPISSLIENPTPRKLAARIFGSDVAERPTLIPLNAGTASLNLFCLSGHVLNPLSLQHVAGAIDGVASALGVPLFDQGIMAETFQDATKTAGKCLQRIRDHQPRGPYHLMGFSYGGVVAFEIAQQLRKAGEAVGSLILLDSFVANSLLRALIHARQFFRGALKFSMNHRQDSKERMRLTRERPAIDNEAEYFAARVFENMQRGVVDYKPVAYAGDALLLRSEAKLSWIQSAVYPAIGGWPELIGGKLSVQDVPGDHLSMLEEPNATIVGQRVRSYLTPSN